MKRNLKFCFFFTLKLLTAVSHAQMAVQFVDITTGAGIVFKHINGASDRKFYLETMGSGRGFLGLQ